MREKLFSKVEKILREEENALSGQTAFSVEKRKFRNFGFWKNLLQVFSWGYKAGLYVHHWFYKKGVLQVVKAPIKIISVGNLAVGGRFKTPFTLFLLEQFLKSGKKASVSTRGYLSKVERKNQNLAFQSPDLQSPDFQSPDLRSRNKKYALSLDKKNQKFWSFQQIGDETLLFLQKIQRLKNQNAYVIVGKNRYKSALLAKKLKSEILILDDGFQHRKLLQDVKILLLKKSDLAPQRHFLPRGALRDLPERVKEADFIAVEEKDLSFALQVFEEKKVLAFESFFDSFKDLLTHKKVLNLAFPKEEKKQALLQKQKAAVFCAIGDPLRFIKDLENSGLEIVKRSFLIDHQPVSIPFLKQFSLEAKEKGAQFLICTEKDMVKILFNQNWEDSGFKTDSKPAENINLKVNARQKIALNKKNMNINLNQMSKKILDQEILPIYYTEQTLKMVFGQANLEKALRINLTSAMIKNTQSQNKAKI